MSNNHFVRRLVVFAAAFLVAAPAAQAARPSPVQKLQRELDTLVAAGVPGAILLVRDESRTVRLTSGSARLRPRQAMNAHYRFRVGSITKTFVASVVLELVAEGKLALAAPLERWLPGVIPESGAITVRHLLNHTSGIYNYTDDPRVIAPFLAGNFGRAWTPKELVAMAASHRLLFAPGSAWSYSNTNFILLGLIVEAATGRPLEQELRERIFGPLGLDDTSLPSTAAIDGPHAHGYGKRSIDGTGPLLDVTLINPSWAWAAGAVVSTTDDLADFYRALLRGKLVTKHLVWRMESTVLIAPGSRYGLGLASTLLPCSIVWGHNGSVPGYLTFALSSGNGVRQVLLSLNTDALGAQASTDLQTLLLDAYCGAAARLSR